jgi:hypothetical protein
LGYSLNPPPRRAAWTSPKPLPPIGNCHCPSALAPCYPCSALRPCRNSSRAASVDQRLLTLHLPATGLTLQASVHSADEAERRRRMPRCWLIIWLPKQLAEQAAHLRRRLCRALLLKLAWQVWLLLLEGAAWWTRRLRAWLARDQGLFVEFLTVARLLSTPVLPSIHGAEFNTGESAIDLNPLFRFSVQMEGACCIEINTDRPFVDLKDGTSL